MIRFCLTTLFLCLTRGVLEQLQNHIYKQLTTHVGDETQCPMLIIKVSVTSVLPLRSHRYSTVVPTPRLEHGPSYSV